MPNLGEYGRAIGEWRVLSGPAILRISVLLIIAGILAALIQFLLPAEPPAPVAELPARDARPAPPSEAPAPAAPIAEPEPEPEPVQARRAAPPPPQMPADALAFPPSAPAPSASSPATPPPAPAAPAPPPRGEAEIARAEDSAGPRALALVDLNTASVADLNRLQGGGAIGRAIASKRPYASIDQLLSKRVLSRAVYDRIREQVTVR